MAAPPSPLRMAPDRSALFAPFGAPLSRIVGFAALFALLLTGYKSARNSALERFVVDDLTVSIAACVIGVLDPSLGVRAEGLRLVAPRGGPVVLAECEGVDVLLLLTAAMAGALFVLWQSRFGRSRSRAPT